MKIPELRTLLSSKPLTQSVRDALSAGATVAQIHQAASKMSYTRRAVNSALREAGVRQRRSRKDEAKKG